MLILRDQTGIAVRLFGKKEEDMIHFVKTILIWRLT